MFTSGTTGRPKGVEITQANYAFAGDVMAAAAGLRRDAPPARRAAAVPRQRAVLLLRLGDLGRRVGGADAHLLGERASSPRPPPRGHARQPVRGADADDPRPRRDARSTACGCCTAGTREHHRRPVRRRSPALFGCRPRQLYGMTETIPAVLTEPGRRPGAVDRWAYPTLGCVVDVHDADGDAVADGEVGEIVVGGDPGHHAVRRLPRRPRDDRQRPFRDGWFRTGDRARRDDDGRFLFDGRRGDVLKVAGENVSTVEVEAVLSAHPAVLEAAVVGEPDAIRDEVPVGVRRRRRPGQPADRRRRARRLVRRPAGEVEAAACASRSSTSCRARASARSASSCCETREHASQPNGALDDASSPPTSCESFDAVVADVATGVPLPPAIYTSEEFLAFERDADLRPRVAVRRRVEPGPEPGDYFTYDGRRRADHRRRATRTATVRAFSRDLPAPRACRSPTATATAPSSRARTTTGATTSTAGCSARRRWSARVGFDKSDFPLPSLPVELWQGFVFVHFDPDAAAAGADARRATSRSSSTTTSTTPSARASTLARPSVELEGHVRELQRRLPRQPAAPPVQTSARAR